MELYRPGVTIGELAKRTGIGISTVRAWERRYGFPVPQRLPAGHRRYSERDVEAIIEILSERQAGATLGAALARVKARATAPRSSVFATIRQALADVSPVALSKHGMLAISRAIEDEAAARADDAVFLGSFQAERYWRQTQPRWRHVAARAQLAVALGAFSRSNRRGNLWEVPISVSAPVAREWAVICDSATFAACLVGVERPGQEGQPDGHRIFEALWTVEPLGVRESARTAADIAVASAPPLGDALGGRLAEPAVATYDTIRSSTALTNRILTYLQAASARPVRADARRPPP